MFRYAFTGISPLILSMTSMSAFCAPIGGGHLPNVRLVQAAGLDRISMLAVPRIYFRSFDQSDQQFRKFTGCVLSGDSSGFKNIFSEAVQTSMSKEEVQSALAFYESDIGKRIVAITLADARRELGIADHVLVPALSANEKSKVDSFNETSAGQKFASEKLMRTGKTAVLFFEVCEKILSMCKPS